MNQYDTDDEAISASIRRLRKQRRLTQTELADMIGWTRIGVAQAEGGRKRYRIEDLARLCEAFDVSYRALLAGQAETLARLEPRREQTIKMIVAALTYEPGAE
jgi:transcriptional regulator with XRE-family HTH domain